MVATRIFYVSCAAAAAVGLLVIGFTDADVLSIGRHPSEEALQDFLVSLLIGVIAGVACMAYQARLFRRHRDFFVAFRAALPGERLRWSYQRWVLLWALPALVGGEVLIIAVATRELQPLTVWLAIVLCLPLVAGPWAEVNALARERRITMNGSGGDRSVPQVLGDPGLRAGEYARRVALWLGLAVTLAFTGYTMTLPRRERRDEARVFLRDLSRHSVADHERFYRTTDSCRRAARTCDPAKLAAAEGSAKEILKVAGEYEYDWNYGNALHYGHLVLGRLALARGDSREATRGLLRAGLTTGSPQLGDYGPDMTLARELLQRGEKTAVLRYFSLCNRFWRNLDRNCIAAWSDDLRAGQLPDFGSMAGPMPQPERGWTCALIEGADAARP